MSTIEAGIEEHKQRLLVAFGAVLSAEERVSDVKRRQDEATILLQQERNGAEAALEKAWMEIQGLLAETGEVEVILPGEVTDFKITWSSPRETVKVEPEAVPDEFCKTERRPRLKEIGEYLKGLRDAGLDLPNWGSFQTGSTKLGWKAIKRNNSTK
jgi:hypothetical protein